MSALLFKPCQSSRFIVVCLFFTMENLSNEYGKWKFILFVLFGTKTQKLPKRLLAPPQLRLLYFFTAVVDVSVNGYSSFLSLRRQTFVLVPAFVSAKTCTACSAFHLVM